MKSLRQKKQQEKAPHAGLKLEGGCTFPMVWGAITDVSSTGYWMNIQDIGISIGSEPH